MDKDLQETFLALVRLGIGLNASFPSMAIAWTAMKVLAEQQGLSAIVLDGIEKLPTTSRPPQEFVLEWIGEVIQSESIYSGQFRDAVKMAQLFQRNNVRTYVLKGVVVAECYPKPEHRVSVDVDSFLLPMQGEFDAWRMGNELIKTQGFEVGFDFYKNSTFYLPNLIVENHQFLTPFRGNKKLRALERKLQDWLCQDDGGNYIEETCLSRPPVMVTALFLIEHAYSHFLHEWLTWRHVLDWMLFSRKYKKEIDWVTLEVLIDEYGFRKFYNSFYIMGVYLYGETSGTIFNEQEKRMISNIWENLDLHDTVKGFKGKLALVGNTLRARWKYKHFTEMTMLEALWIQVKGFLFINNPNI